MSIFAAAKKGAQRIKASAREPIITVALLGISAFSGGRTNLAQIWDQRTIYCSLILSHAAANSASIRPCWCGETTARRGLNSVPCRLPLSDEDFSMFMCRLAAHSNFETRQGLAVPVNGFSRHSAGSMKSEGTRYPERVFHRAQMCLRVLIHRILESGQY